MNEMIAALEPDEPHLSRVGAILERPRAGLDHYSPTPRDHVEAHLALARRPERGVRKRAFLDAGDPGPGAGPPLGVPAGDLDSVLSRQCTTFRHAPIMCPG